jgi:hypothetical protein
MAHEQEVSTKRLNLSMKTSQEVIGGMELKVALLHPAGITSGRRQLQIAIERTPQLNCHPD